MLLRVFKNVQFLQKNALYALTQKFLEEVKKLNIVSNVLNDQNVMIFS